MASIGRAGLPEAGGEWLLAAVAPESLAILAATMATGPTSVLVLAALALWCLGAVVYLLLMPLLGLRLAESGLPPSELTPDWWIVSGAAAIASVAAGAIAVAGGPHAMQAARVAAWGIATVAIPPLALAERRRAVATSDPLGDLSGRYATVFPLGMYATATEGVAPQLHSGVLAVAGAAVLGVAGVIWLAVTGILLGSGRSAGTTPLGG